MRTWLEGTVLVVVVAHSGCTGGGSSHNASSASSSSSGGTVDGGGSLVGLSAGDFYTQNLSRALCESQLRCSAELGPGYSSVNGCMEVSHGLWQAMALAYGVADIGAALSSANTLDVTLAEKCLTWLQTNCTIETPFLCRQALVPRDPIPEGGDCSTMTGPTGLPLTSRACASGTACLPEQSQSGCRKCLAHRPEEAPCNPYGNDCASQICDCANASCSEGKCAPAHHRTVKARGASCTNPWDCGGFLACGGPPGSKTCQEEAGLGQACDQVGCMADLDCDYSGSRLCVALKADGSTCGSDCQHLCRRTSATGFDGTCGPWSQLPGDGEPCSWGRTGFVCAPGLVENNPNNDATCTCVTPKQPGEACQATTECYLPNAPERANFCVSGVCANGFPEGATCASNDVCVSHYCSPQTQTCAAAPAVCQ